MSGRPDPGTPTVLRSYWYEAARHVKRAVLSRRMVVLAGAKYRVAYEARDLRSDTSDMAFLKRCAEGKRCIFDIGGNLGLTALVMASSADPDGSLYAFEASEASCLIIRENALLNDMPGINVVNALVSDRSGRVMDLNWNFSSERASVIAAVPDQTIALKKCTLAIDDFVAGVGVNPDFVKVDVEGAEFDVLIGMSKTLTEKRPMVGVEVHAWPGVSVGKNVDQILSLTRDVRYGMIHLRTKQPICTGELFRSIAEPPEVAAQARVLLLPEEAETPDWLASFDTSYL